MLRLEKVNIVIPELFRKSRSLRSSTIRRGRIEQCSLEHIEDGCIILRPRKAQRAFEKNRVVVFQPDFKRFPDNGFHADTPSGFLRLSTALVVTVMMSGYSV
jgi:hypothetical protein